MKLLPRKRQEKKSFRKPDNFDLVTPPMYLLNAPLSITPLLPDKGRLLQKNRLVYYYLEIITSIGGHLTKWIPLLTNYSPASGGTFLLPAPLPLRKEGATNLG